MRKDELVGKDRKLAERLPTIKCICGAQILLLPDLKVMNHAIEFHVAYHRKKEKDPNKKIAKTTHIRQALIKQLLERTATTDKTN